MSVPNDQFPTVSVIIPAYNADKFLPEAIESVLNQTYQSYELIVVNDGSTDKTEEILLTFKDRVLCKHQKNRGPSAARNAGIEIAQGKYISFLDADDLWTPDKLEVQVAFLEIHPDIAFVCADHLDFNASEVVLHSFLEDKKKTFGESLVTEIPIQDAFGKLIRENFVSTPTVMVRKSCLEKTGLFDESLWSVEDRDLWFRIAAKFHLACLPKILCKRRIHHDNISRQSMLALQGRITVLERNCRAFPHLVAPEIWDMELANHYCQLGYLFLENHERVRALQAGLKSLIFALRQVTKKQMFASYSWGLGIGLIPAALLGWRISRLLFRPLKELRIGR